MSNKELIIPERSRDIGSFMVGRLLPFIEKRTVGPFIFIDHMGPVEMPPGAYIDVDQHPHVGLATLTFLLEGSIMHRDSLGTTRQIEPGSVNWMVAGKGCAHTERTPEALRSGERPTRLHGYQIWVALPKELEDMEPEFHHVDAADLPSWADGPARFTLVAGKGYGRQSVLPVHSDLFMVDVRTEDNYQLEIAGQLEGEIGICVVSGAVRACEHIVEAGNMLVSKIDGQCAMDLIPGTHVILFGGTPLPEERHIYWNFVSSSPQKIDAARERWAAKAFPKVPGDDTYIPLPQH